MRKSDGNDRPVFGTGQVAETTKRVGLEISQSTAYRLRQSVRKGGEQALQEGRRGHPVTMRGSPVVGTDLSADSFSPSHEIQTPLAERFSLETVWIDTRGGIGFGRDRGIVGKKGNISDQVSFIASLFAVAA